MLWGNEAKMSVICKNSLPHGRDRASRKPPFAGIPILVQSLWPSFDAGLLLSLHSRLTLCESAWRLVLEESGPSQSAGKRKGKT